MLWKELYETILDTGIWTEQWRAYFDRMISSPSLMAVAIYQIVINVHIPGTNYSSSYVVFL